MLFCCMGSTIIGTFWIAAITLMWLLLLRQFLVNIYSPYDEIALAALKKVL